MDNKATSKSIILTYGLYLGIASIVLSVANYSFGNIYKPHMAISIVSYVLTAAFIALAFKAYKEHNSGFLKLGNALKMGVGIALVAGILLAIYFYIFAVYIEPDFITKTGEFQEQMMYEKFPDMDEALIEQQMEMSRKFMSPGFMSAVLLLGSLFTGFIISLVVGLIMKKNEPNF